MFAIHLLRITFSKSSPGDTCMLKSQFRKTKLGLRQHGGKLNRASPRCMCGSIRRWVSPNLHPGSQFDPGPAVVEGWGGGAQEAATHGTFPLGAGWCPLTDWGCKVVFNISAVCICVYARLSVSWGCYIHQNDARQNTQWETRPLQLCLFVQIKHKSQNKLVMKTIVFVL